MSMQSFMSKIMADSFLLTWNILSVVAFIIPFFIWVIGRATSDRWNDYYENQNNNQNDEQNGQYNNQYGQNSSWNNPSCYDEYGYYHGPTHWWQFWKRCNYGDGEGNDNDRRAPWWYIWGGEERGNPEDEGRAVIIFMYLWMLVLLGGVAYIGNNTAMTLHKLEVLRWILIGFANFCFMVMVMVIGLEGIEVDAREMERDGFYGQTAVLLLFTSFFALVQSIVFISWTTKRINVLKSLQEESLTGSGKSDTGEYVSVEYDKQIAKLENQPDAQGYKC